jgi:hypothetical protein
VCKGTQESKGGLGRGLIIILNSMVSAELFVNMKIWTTLWRR